MTSSATVSSLCFIRDDTRILLGQKKRGFGQGYWNGFGGKIQPGETIEQAAKRELKEESGLDLLDSEKRGELFFEFDHDPTLKLHVHIFVAKQVQGEPVETEEMKPQWFAIDALPYSDMWADDPHWMPLLLAGKKFKGTFYFKDLKTIRQVKLREV